MTHSYKFLQSSDSPSLFQPLPGRNTSALLLEAPLHKGGVIQAALSLSLSFSSVEQGRRTGSGLGTPVCHLPHCLSVTACVFSWPWPVSLHTATCTALAQNFVHSLSTYFMRGTVYPPNSSQGSCVITVVHFHSGRRLESLLLEARHPETFRDGLEKEHCSWKAASKAEDEEIPTVWVKSMLQQCPHGKCWQCGTEQSRRASSSGTSRNPACRITFGRRITTIHIYPI